MYEYYQGGSITQLIFNECFKETIVDHAIGGQHQWGQP